MPGVGVFDYLTVTVDNGSLNDLADEVKFRSTFIASTYSDRDGSVRC